MAEDAFALSPISARASLPSEADYDAIRDAFMETARGRWFLTEFAKRNRNADTGMVLEAVARIEAGIAARGSASPAPAALIAMIRPLIAEARAAADAALSTPETGEHVAAGRRASRIIREISWSLRETGTDPRICNIFDAQLLALDSLHEHVETDVHRELVGEAFDDLILKIEEIGSGVRLAQPAEPAPIQEPVERVGANLDAAETAPVAQSVESTVPADATDVASPPPTEDERAADDAMLDRIAMEMSAPDIDDADDFGNDDHALAELRSLAEAAPQPVPTMAVPAMPAPVTAAPAAPPSLGAALIASGIVRMPRAASEALAPFRRMSQIEKIAFFS